MSGKEAVAIQAFQRHLLARGYRQTAVDRYENRVKPMAVEMGCSHLEVSLRFSETSGSSMTDEGVRNVRPIPGHEIVHLNLAASPADLFNRFEYAVDRAEKWITDAMITRAKRDAGAVD